MEDNKIENKVRNTESEDFDIVFLFFKVWEKRKRILKIACAAFFVGLIVAFSMPKEFRTKVTLAPESTSKSNMGNIGSLAAIAGFNLGGIGSEDAISPELYPQIISSIPFLVELFDVEVTTKDTLLITNLYDYIDNYQKLPWWNHILSFPFDILRWGVSLFKKDKIENKIEVVNIFSLTHKQSDIAHEIRGRINSTVDKKTGIISISVNMQDPVVSATVADVVKNKLQAYITNYRTTKAREDLIFTEKLYEEAKKEYIMAQQKYASFTDNNQNIVLMRFQNEADQLKNEMQLAYNVYNQLAQQLQIAKAKLQEVTPIYAVVDPPTVSLLPVSPNKSLILVGFVLLSVLIYSGRIILKYMYNKKMKK